VSDRNWRREGQGLLIRNAKISGGKLFRSLYGWIRGNGEHGCNKREVVCLRAYGQKKNGRKSRPNRDMKASLRKRKGGSGKNCFFFVFFFFGVVATRSHDFAFHKVCSSRGRLWFGERGVGSGWGSTFAGLGRSTWRTQTIPSGDGDFSVEDYRVTEFAVDEYLALRARAQFWRTSHVSPRQASLDLRFPRLCSGAPSDARWSSGRQ